MKNMVQPGKILTLTAPSPGVTKGVGVMIGGLLVVPAQTAATGESFSGDSEGVFEMPKTSAIAFAEGEAIFWDDTAKLWKKTATGYFQAGTAVAVAANPSSTVLVKLKGFAVPAV